MFCGLRYHVDAACHYAAVLEELGAPRSAALAGATWALRRWTRSGGGVA